MKYPKYRKNCPYSWIIVRDLCVNGLSPHSEKNGFPAGWPINRPLKEVIVRMLLMLIQEW